MINVRRLSFPTDRTQYSQAFLWQLEQQELYGENIGFHSFDEFVRAGDKTLDLAVEEDGRLLAFCSLILQAKGCCRAAVIAPKRPRIRSILAGLRALQRAYFGELGHFYLCVCLPDGNQFDRARRIARLMGWREVNPNYFEFHLFDHLRSQYVA